MTTYQNSNIVWQDSSYIFKYDGSNFDSIPCLRVNYGSIISDSDTAFYYQDNNKLTKIGKNFKRQVLDSTSGVNVLYFIGVLENHIYFQYNKSGNYLYKTFNLITKNYEDIFTISDQHGIKSSYNKIYTFSSDWNTKGRANIYELINGSLIQGQVYEDVNKNCTLDAGEKPKNKLTLSFNNGKETFLTITNDTGFYRLAVLPGTYTMKVEKKYLKTQFDSCGGNKVFQLDSIYTQNIPYVLPSNLKDIGATFNANLGFIARRGFTEGYVINYENYGSTTENITLVLEYPDSVVYKSSSMTPANHTGRKLTFVVNGIKKLEKGSILLSFEIDAKKKLNSPTRFVCQTFLKTNDKDTTNNTDTLIQKVRAAIDPNIKQSSPEGYVQKPVSKIRYHIQFQNEGNYKATRVVVVDTFDTRLPLTKLQMLGTKHAYSLRVENGNVLIWEFDNINLLPKSDGEQESQGFITFEATLNKPLLPGETVKNRAHIYFDYEAPLPTPFSFVTLGADPNALNPVLSNLKGVSVYPNPFMDQITISGNNELGEVSVFNTLGVQVFQKKIEESNYIISTENWAKGIYVLKFHAQNTSMKILKL
jgi:hypothetical protein